MVGNNRGPSSRREVAAPSRCPPPESSKLPGVEKVMRRTGGEGMVGSRSVAWAERRVSPHAIFMNQQSRIYVRGDGCHMDSSSLQRLGMQLEHRPQ